MNFTFSNVEFVTILPAKDHHKEDFCAVQLRAKEVVKNGKTLLLGGAGITRKRYVIITVLKSVVDRMNLKSGDDFTKALVDLGDEFANIYGQGARINTREITQSVYDKLDSEKQKAYQAKIIPANDAKKQKEIPLYHNGERIYFVNGFVAMTDKNHEDNVLKASTLGTIEKKERARYGATV